LLSPHFAFVCPNNGKRLYSTSFLPMPSAGNLLKTQFLQGLGSKYRISPAQKLKTTKSHKSIYTKLAPFPSRKNLSIIYEQILFLRHSGF